MRKLSFCILLALFLQGCAPRFDCNDQIKAELKSPDGKFIATYYERDCGATTDTATRINLRLNSAKFSADEGQVFISEGQFQVKLVWDGDTSLRIECLDCRPRDIFRQEMSWSGVRISYLVFDPSMNNHSDR